MKSTIWSTPHFDHSKIQGYTYNRLREKVEFQLHDTSLWQLPDSSFWISSNSLFCGNSDKKYGEKGGYQLILVRIFKFQSMPSMSWRHAIKGSVVSIQEWNIFKTSMPRFMFTIFATTTKIEHQFMPDVDMKRKSLKAGLSPGTQRVGIWQGDVYI